MKTYYKYLIIFLISIGGLFLRFFISGHGIFGDGNAYYAYSHALYFEHGLNFDGIYQHLSNFHGKKYTFSRVFWGTDKGPFGVRYNPWTIGTGIFWLPALAVVDTASRLFGIALNQYNLAYEWSIGILGICYSITGLWLLEKYLRKRFDNKNSELIVISIYAATNLLYYISLEPALSHQIIFFLLSGLLFGTSKRINHNYQFFLIGITMGLFAITRMADSVLLIPIAYQLWAFSLSHLNPKSILCKVSILGLGFLLGITPQLITQYVMFGTIWQNPYFNGDNGQFTLSLSHLWQSLFSVHRGLLSWTPFLLVGIVGIIKQCRHKNDYFFHSIALSLLIFWLMVAQWSGAASAGFGARLFIGSLPYFALGIGIVLNQISLKRKLALIIVGIIFNMLVLNQFLTDPDRMVKDHGLTYANFLVGNVTSLLAIPAKLFK